MAALRLEQTLSQHLTKEQRLELKQLMLIRQELRAEPPPEALRGLEGIGRAHNLLQEKGLRGILIGSLVSEIWKTGDPTALAKHKDVDIAVLPDKDKAIDLDTFEGGIDWWLPKSGELTAREVYGSVQGKFDWWENGHGIVIGIGLKVYDPTKKIPPGLLIPTPEKLIEMRVAELMARIDETKVHISDATYDALHTKLGKEVNPQHFSGNGVVPLPTFVTYRYQHGIEKIPPEKIVELDVKGKKLPELVAINSRNTKG